MTPGLRLAEKWLWKWGDQVRARGGGGLFLGNIEPNRYRPVHDPHPNTFLITQVERCLNDFGVNSPEKALAEHMFCRNEPLASFRHPSLPAQNTYQRRKLRVRIIVALANQIDTLDPRDLTIAESADREMARARLL